MSDATMNLLSIIAPTGLEGSASRASPRHRPMGKALPRRVARKRSTPSNASTSRGTTSRRGQARRVGTNGTLKRRRSESKTSGSGREDRPGHEPNRHSESGSSAARPGPRRAHATKGLPTCERVRRARAAAELSRGRGGKPVSMMDVILDAQAPTAGLDADDLRDAVEQYQRIAFGQPSAEDDSLADMFIPGRYEARQEAFWRELAAAAQIDYSPRSIYHVSAERSTATWDGSLAGDGNTEPI